MIIQRYITLLYSKKQTAEFSKTRRSALLFFLEAIDLLPRLFLKIELGIFLVCFANMANNPSKGVG